jgi:Glyoxalase-like domain
MRCAERLPTEHVTLRLDHLFVCCERDAPEAQTLLDAGLIEGAPNAHPGQGTANRRFFFDRGFVELLWVHDEREARSPRTQRTRLWDRWSQRRSGANPFGICLSSTIDVLSRLPFTTWTYEPEYLPPGRCIYFADGMPLTEPELFVLPASPGHIAQQTTQRLPLREMLSVSIGLPDATRTSPALAAAQQTGLVDVHQSPVPELLVRFRSAARMSIHLTELGISLLGQP